MSALLIGFLLVMASAAAFGFALFGRRPVPQPAIATGAARRGPYSGAEDRPSGSAGVVHGPGSARPTPAGFAASGGVHLSAADVRPSTARRIRAIGLLAVSVVGSAVLIGAILSIVTVGAILLIS